MQATVDNPNVIDVSDIEGLLVNFQNANKTLDAIQKSLNDYLETRTPKLTGVHEKHSSPETESLGKIRF